MRRKGGFEIIPALQDVGGSFWRSLSSFKMRFDAMFVKTLPFPSPNIYLLRYKIKNYPKHQSINPPSINIKKPRIIFFRVHVFQTKSEKEKKREEPSGADRSASVSVNGGRREEEENGRRGERRWWLFPLFYFMEYNRGLLFLICNAN